MFNLKKIKERRQKQQEYIRNEVKSIVKEAMDEWADGVNYLTPNKGDGVYHCSKPDCEGVRIQEEE